MAEPVTTAAPTGPRADDAAVVARLRQRDEAALAEVYDAHAGAVYGVLTRLLDPHTAQEVTQDVFLRLWTAPAAFDASRAGLRAYLLVMARSRALDRLRATRPTTPLHTDDGTDVPIPDRRPGPAAGAEDRQRRDRVRAALHALSPAHRESVERAFLRGHTREEIARDMGVPVGTVKSRINAALGHLRRELGEEVDAWLE